MNNFVYEKNQFIYINSTEKKILLNCNDFIKNKSRVPFHAITNEPTVPNMIFDLLTWHSNYSEHTNQPNYGIYYALIDVLVTAYHVKSSAPKKVLELGCANGLMSHHLATILGMLHPDSLLYSVADSIGNESNNQWLDFISEIYEMPRLGFLATDYDDTNLNENHFDITIINGSVPIPSPDKVLTEAWRVTKNGGFLICYAENQPLLESAFQLFFPKREEYFFDFSTKILVISKPN